MCVAARRGSSKLGRSRKVDSAGHATKLLEQRRRSHIPSFLAYHHQPIRSSPDPESIAKMRIAILIRVVLHSGSSQDWWSNQFIAGYQSCFFRAAYSQRVEFASL